MKPVSLIFFYFFFAAALLPDKTVAQRPTLLGLNIDNGLPSNQVYGAITDRYGYLWITTPKGVARYNGYDLKLFNISEGLPYEDIWQLVEDKKGRIWLGTMSDEVGYLFNGRYHKAFIKNSNGIIYPRNIRQFEDGIIFWSYYMSGSQQITLCTTKDDTLHTRLISNSIFSDSVQSREFSTSHSKFIVFFMISNNGAISSYYGDALYNVYTGKSVIAEKQYDIGQSAEIKLRNRKFIYLNDLIFSTYIDRPYHTLHVANKTDSGTENIDLRKYGLDDERIYNFCPATSSKNSFYIITKNHIGKFEVTDKLHFIGDAKLTNLISGDHISDYDEDNFWGTFISTDSSGMIQQYNCTDNFIKKQDLKLNNYKYVGGDLNAHYWWNNKTHSLLKITSRKTESFILDHTGLVNKIFPYSGDTMFISGTEINLLLSNGHTVNIDKYVLQNLFTGFTKDKNNIFLVSSTGLTKGHLEKNVYIGKFLDADRYRNIFYDSLRKNVWAYSNYKVLISTDNGSTEILKNEQLGKFGVKKIDAICIDNKYGNLFFKGQNNITIYSPDGNRCKQLLQRFNHEDSKIYVHDNKFIVIGRFGIIFTTIKGLMDISAPLTYYNIKNTNYNYVYDCQLAWNKILLSTDKGTYEVNIPTDNEIENGRYDSVIYNYKFLVNYHDTLHNIREIDTIRLYQKDLRLQFDIINPNGNGRLKYTWQLANDTTWHELNGNELSFPSLAPDNYYKLLVNAHDNVWRSDDLVLYVYIRPHWWQTHHGRRIVWTSAILLVLLLFTVAILITRKLVLKATAKKNMQMELELKSIYSQINPHFIFNTLNSALLLVSKNRMEEAYIHISKFSRLLRSYIKSSRNKLITIAEEIANLKNYIELQQTRFKGRFEFKIILGDNIEANHVKIPSLLLQPFVENAINHGILNKQGLGHLKVEFRLSEDKHELLCIIEDDGIGRKNSKIINDANTEKDESYGNLMIKDLVNVFNKYEQMNIQISYDDKQEPETGTIVTIAIKKFY